MGDESLVEIDGAQAQVRYSGNVLYSPVHRIRRVS